MERHLFSRLFSKRELHPVCSMVMIGEFDSGTHFSVRVYAKEGPVAHFHIVDTKTKKEGCVKIEKAEYFPTERRHSHSAADRRNSFRNSSRQSHLILRMKGKPIMISSGRNGTATTGSIGLRSPRSCRTMSFLKRTTTKRGGNKTKRQCFMLESWFCPSF